MKQKNYLTAIGVIITLFLVLLSFDINSARLRVGTLYINDSTAGLASINKGLYINGDAKAYSLRLTDNNFIYLGDAGGTSGIKGFVSDLYYNGDYHYFKDATGSTTALQIGGAVTTINTYTQLGGSSAPAIKQVLVKAKLGSAGGTTNTAHGITDYNHIISVDWGIRDDSTDRFIPAGYAGTTGLSTGAGLFLNATIISFFLPTLSVNLANDTLKCLITYRQ